MSFWVLVAGFVVLLLLSSLFAYERDRKQEARDVASEGQEPLEAEARRLGVSARELGRVPHQALDIVGAYGRVLETAGVGVQPESLLPYPRVDIERALNATLSMLTDAESPKAAQTIRRGLRELHRFIPDREIPEDREEATWLAIFLLGRASMREKLAGILGSALSQRGPSSGAPLGANNDEFIQKHSAEGQVFRKNGLLDKAVEQFEAIVARLPENQTAREELRDLYREKRDLGKSADQSDALSLICRLKGDNEGASKYDSEARQTCVARAQIEYWSSTAFRERFWATSDAARRAKRFEAADHGSPQGESPERGLTNVAVSLECLASDYGIVPEWDRARLVAEFSEKFVFALGRLHDATDEATKDRFAYQLTELEHVLAYLEALAIDRALEIDLRNANAWINKGSALRNLKRYDEAIACYDRALDIDPRNATAWINKGIALEHLAAEHPELYPPVPIIRETPSRPRLV
jgi:tetratricopeptide (TPR) repeat protein